KKEIPAFSTSMPTMKLGSYRHFSFCCISFSCEKPNAKRKLKKKKKMRFVLIYNFILSVFNSRNGSNSYDFRRNIFIQFSDTTRWRHIFCLIIIFYPDLRFNPLLRSADIKISKTMVIYPQRDKNRVRCRSSFNHRNHSVTIIHTYKKRIHCFGFSGSIGFKFNLHSRRPFTSATNIIIRTAGKQKKKNSKKQNGGSHLFSYQDPKLFPACTRDLHNGIS